MKTTLILLVAIIGFAGNIHAQKFWLTTYEFPGGPKTGLAGMQDSVLFYSTPSMVFRSSNAGQHFDTIFTASRLYTLFLDPSHVLYGGGNGKIFVSMDLGLTWDSVVVGSYPVVMFQEAGSGNIFAATGTSDMVEGYVGDGIFYSSDAGKHWQQRNTGLPIKPFVDRLAADSHGRVYITIADDQAPDTKGLFVSDDLGLTWQHEQIVIDGANTIENTVFISSASGLSVSPDDSVYLSFEGIARADASGVLVHLNLVKHRDEIGKPTQWQRMQVGGTGSWWYDAQLNNIHFARNGDRYSSRTGTATFGATYFMRHGAWWQSTDRGLGLDATGMRSEQTFYETSTGKIYMIQAYDERLYWADTSTLAVDRNSQKLLKVSIYPNPVQHGEQVRIELPLDVAGLSSIRTINSLGQEVLWFEPRSGNTFVAPAARGVYLVHSETGQPIGRFVVY
ncbi:MAG: hypothetical protein JSS75_13335 [Bacteroidetes bacterium]|nr:hypothetical protein [Bacteroidota bacterium]